MSSVVPPRRVIFSAGIFPGKAADPDPAKFTTWPDDTKSFVEVSGLGRLFNLCQHVSSIVPMNDLLIRGRFFDQGLAGAASDGFVFRVDEGGFLGLGVDHPEDFLDVVGHLVEFLLPVFKDSPCLAFGPVHGRKTPASKRAKTNKELINEISSARATRSN